MRIWKYKLEVVDVQEIELPLGAEILTAQTQYSDLNIWVKVDEKETQKEVIKIAIYGTGNQMPLDCGKYIATVQLCGGGLVFHVFDLSS